MFIKAISFCLLFTISVFSKAQHGGYRYVGFDNSPELLYRAELNSKVRIPYSDHGLWGFLNEKGEPVVEAQFPKVHNYFEDKAAVRTSEGTYGYFDLHGVWVAEPQFDDAYPFVKGVAIAFLQDNPCLVHADGKVVELSSRVKSVEYSMRPGHYIVTHENEKQGLVNQDGEYVLAADYKSISEYSDGYFMVKKSVGKEKTMSGLVDENFEFAVPLGKYTIMSNFKSGAFRIHAGEGEGYWGSPPVFVSLEGDTLYQDKKDVYELVDDHRRRYDGGFYIVEMFVPENFLDEDDPKYDKWERDLAVVNDEGEILWKNDDYGTITGFHQNRAFVNEKESNRWFLINEKGEKLHPRGFVDVYSSNQRGGFRPFKDGYEAVLTDEGWALINANGQVITGPLYQETKGVAWMDKLMWYREGEGENDEKFGVWDAELNQSTGAIFDDFTWIDAQSKIANVRIGEDEVIQKLSGEPIWSQSTTESVGALNVDFMVRGYFYASSPPKSKYAGYGGWGGSGNQYRSVDIDAIDKNVGLQVVVSESADTVFASQYLGYEVKVLNTGMDTVVFSAQDSRLYMKVQAKNEKGAWQDIEYLPSSWCGNSYHQLYLPSACAWTFVTPFYSGGIETEFRIELSYDKSGKEKTVYSNTYKGSVNPGQFWQKPEYSPMGIMDPYND